jgi:hypothetical protein
LARKNPISCLKYSLQDIGFIRVLIILNKWI